jgi:hypothetical protein
MTLYAQMGALALSKPSTLLLQTADWKGNVNPLSNISFLFHL